MIGSLIGAGLGAVGSIFGGISASKTMKRVKKDLQRQRKENEDWYNRRYNEDATQRADAQAVLSRTEESIRKRNRQAAGVQAVSGGTEESVAAAKAAGNEALADVATRIAVNGEARKDAVEAQFREKDERLRGQLDALKQQKAANISQAISGVLGAAGNIAGAIDEYGETRSVKVDGQQ